MASWSNPCKDIASTYAELADTHTNLVFLTVDVDELAVSIIFLMQHSVTKTIRIENLITFPYLYTLHHFKCNQILQTLQMERCLPLFSLEIKEVFFLIFISAQIYV